MSGERLIKILMRHDYYILRTAGSHVRMIHDGPPKHSVTVPLHAALKAGTLNGILACVANHLKIHKAVILKEL